MFHFVDSFTGEAAFLEGRIARPRRHSLAMATFFMVQRRQALGFGEQRNSYRTRSITVLMESATLWKVDATEAALLAEAGLDRFP